MDATDAADPDQADADPAEPWSSTAASRRVRGHEQFRRLLEKERARTDRSGCEFSLVVFGVNDVDQHDDDDGTTPVDSLSRCMSQLTALVCRRARETDEVGYCGGALIVVLLTGTPAAGGRRFVEDITAAMGPDARDIVSAVYSYPSAWITSDTQSRVVQHSRLGDSHAARGNGDGDRSGNGDGDRSGNGNGNGNGHGNGNGGAVVSGRASPNGDDEGLKADQGNTEENSEGGVVVVVTPSHAGLGAGPDAEARQPTPAPVNGPIQLLFAQPMPAWKRAIDVFGAALGLVTFAPIMLLVAVGVRLTSRGPVIFGQVRAGQGGRPFVLYKFRSMRADAEAQQGRLRARSEQDGPAFKMRCDPRVTPFGRFIRKSSLDELPQLWNVLKGDMSLVGPRPLPWAEACACEPWQRRRLDVMPGITCIWQVEGRSRVSFARWMRMDIAYIRSRSLLRDVWLIIRTIPAVILRRGAN